MKKRIFKVVYIRSSKYDDEGYVVRFWRGVLPSNTLSCLKSLTRQVAKSGELGDDLDVAVECYDDTVERIPVRRLARENRRPDTRVVVGLAGVQSNQFARAADLAIEFREAGVPVMIGGFHVSGVLALFHKPSDELQRLLDHGVTLVKGEVEAPGVLTRILRDALNGGMEPLYDIKELPCLTDAPVPQTDKKDLRRFFIKNMATIDTSRGCPFNCSFCTVVNVQGHKMRHRSAECVLGAVEKSCAEGINVFFFTDDNLARSPVWEELFDGLSALRERGVNVEFMIQVDTLAYRIPRFVEKAARAGCYRVFVGVESLNAENLAAAAKNHNKADDFAAMVQAWRDVGILVYAGYIIGFPYDTPESVRRDVEALRTHVKVDQASFFMFTPIPGSRDHQRMVAQCVPMDADLNNYDSVHETYHHPHFAPGEWFDAYVEACQAFYGKEYIVDILLRTPKKHYWGLFWTCVYFRYCALTKTHPMLTGLFPLKGWKRRPSYPRESVWRLAWRRARDLAVGIRLYGKIFFEFQEVWLLTRKPSDPRWATLAEIRQRWAEVHQRVTEYDVRGHCQAARDEMAAMLHSASACLRGVAEFPRLRTQRLRKKLQRKAAEIDAYLSGFEVQMPSWRRVIDAEKYISESVVAGYEELAIRYVAKRRRFNAYRAELIERLKSGHILTMNVGRAVATMAFEVSFGVRFVWTVLTSTAGRGALGPHT
jgi:hypothetical protein